MTQEVPQCLHLGCPGHQNSQRIHQRLRIRQGPVVGRRRASERAGNGRELVVREIGPQRAGDFHGIQNRYPTENQAVPGRFMGQKIHVELCVVGQQHRAGAELHECRQDLIESGLSGHVLVPDPVDPRRTGRDRDARIDEALEVAHLIGEREANAGQFHDPFTRRHQSGGLGIEGDKLDFVEGSIQPDLLISQRGSFPAEIPPLPTGALQGEAEV